MVTETLTELPSGTLAVMVTIWELGVGGTESRRQTNADCRGLNKGGGERIAYGLTKTGAEAITPPRGDVARIDTGARDAMVLVGMGRARRCGECGDVGPESLSESDRGSAGSVELLAEVVLLEEKLHGRSLHASSRSVVLALDADRVPYGCAMRAECFSAKLSASICRKIAGTATVSDIFICFDSNAQKEDTCDCPLGDSMQLAA